MNFQNVYFHVIAHSAMLKIYIYGINAHVTLEYGRTDGI